MIASLVLVHCWDGVRLQFTIFIQVTFRYVCSTIMVFIVCENSLLFVSYLVGLISPELFSIPNVAFKILALTTS